MGEREATMEQLDAMQEPLLRERQQKDQQKDYLERVRKRAADRAREILAEAYVERQKILQEAHAELEAERAAAKQEIAALKAEAEAARTSAKGELARAETVGHEADVLREKARDEGFQAGMNQAGAELREFRADMGNELATLMRAVEAQCSQITAYWRDDLAELMRVAVHAGTGYVLDSQHEEILTNLVFQAIHLLEERSVITLRVNPEDESIVSDLFKAAREKAPELNQWIVNGDETIDRGGLVAESGSGSVDLRRQNFEELLHSILDHLFLPVREADKEGLAAIHDQVESASLRFAVPEEEAIERAEASLTRDMATASQQPNPAGAGVDVPKSPAPSMPPVGEKASRPKDPPVPVPDADVADVAPAGGDQLQTVQDATGEFELPDDVFDLDEDPSPSAPQKSVSPSSLPELEEELLSAPGDIPASGAPSHEAPQKELAATSAPGEGVTQDPNLRELEDELFPVSEDEEHEVLQHGGFLPKNQAS